MNHLFLSFMGFLTGLVDSIVGGGGLISLPTLSIAIAPGAEAIGTNKIVGSTRGPYCFSCLCTQGSFKMA